jgi:uncharacterized protein
MQSCFYEGTVSHRRFAPVAHRFRYRLFLVYVDLAEVSTLFGARGLWSTKWPAVARFHRGDHLGHSGAPLDEAVRDVVQSRLSWRPCGPIRLLTNFRYFGFQMNPVSLFYCFDADGRRPCAVVAEVNNTPWNERHCYVLDLRGGELGGELGGDGRFSSARHPKQFHVSPFFPMEMEYRWQIPTPGERLAIFISSFAGEVKQFDAALRLERKAINSVSRREMLARYPAMTLRNYARIYWQAFRLWRKEVPYFPHPDAAVLSGPDSGRSTTRSENLVANTTT